MLESSSTVYQGMTNDKKFSRIKKTIKIKPFKIIFILLEQGTKNTEKKVKKNLGI